MAFKRTDRLLGGRPLCFVLKIDIGYNLFSQNRHGSLNERSGRRPDFCGTLPAAPRMLTGVCTCVLDVSRVRATLTAALQHGLEIEGPGLTGSRELDGFTM